MSQATESLEGEVLTATAAAAMRHNQREVVAAFGNWIKLNDEQRAWVREFVAGEMTDEQVFHDFSVILEACGFSVQVLAESPLAPPAESSTGMYL